MRVVSHPEADEELEAAALWYEERQPGLGDDFLDQFEHTLRRIVAEPERWRTIRVQGASGQSCRLLISTTLTNWMPVATNSIGEDGSLTFQLDPGSEKQRFCRVVSP